MNETTITLTPEIASLIAQLAPADARLLVSLRRGSLMTPELAALIAKLREELRWLPLLEFFAKMNRFWLEELDWQADNESRPDF
ncbi:MAG: hypothetical protein ACXV7G_12035 [Halobacteriota archaeon]